MTYSDNLFFLVLPKQLYQQWCEELGGMDHEIIEAARLDAIDYAAERCAQARNDFQAKLAAVEARYRDEAAKLRARIEVKTPQPSTVGVSKP